MKKLTFPLLLVLASFVSAEDKAAAPGKLIRVEKSGEQKADAGDLLQIAVGFPVVPGRIVANLKVEIKGDAARTLIVVKTTKPKILGAGEVSAFVKAEKKGEAAIKITPVDDKGKAVGDALEVKLEVAEKK